ncbi:MAG: SRPBCC domain-containing protein [Bdellovibrionota bacterium]
MADNALSEIKTLKVFKELTIAAPTEIVFETLLEPHGPMKEMSMKLEPWPGGRWFRDLGNNTGHLWGIVQSIKPPKLLELIGPTMMSYPVASHIIYRLTEQDGGTLLKFSHQAFGFIAEGLEKDVTGGWGQMLEQIQIAAEKKAK